MEEVGSSTSGETLASSPGSSLPTQKSLGTRLGETPVHAGKKRYKSTPCPQLVSTCICALSLGASAVSPRV